MATPSRSAALSAADQRHERAIRLTRPPPNRELSDPSRGRSYGCRQLRKLPTMDEQERDLEDPRYLLWLR